MVFITANLINQAYHLDEFNLFIVYGPLGIGKSAYMSKVSAEAYGTSKQPNFNKVKDYTIFHPKDFVERCFRMIDRHERQKVLNWDDAGYWLFCLEHTDPFVLSVIKYMNVARTNWAAMILTTPSPSWVIYKMRSFPQCIRLKIVKRTSDRGRTQKLRIAKAYRTWVHPDFKHSGVRSIYADNFDAIMPNDFYWDWYKPLRDDYARQAGGLMERELKNVLKKATSEMKQATEETALAQQ